MAKRSSSGMEVLLGLLTIEPMSGYDLGVLIRQSIGHFWNESYGQIYPNLKKLAAGGFVASKLERQKGKPDKRIYSITPEGRKQLAQWLEVPPQPEIPRNEMLLKLFFGAQVDPAVSIAWVERMAAIERSLVERFRQAQEEIARNQSYPDAPYWKMAARFGELELATHVRWAEETLAELKRLAEKQRSPAKARKEKRHAN
jgi:PadR family transcriptional regulator, regulatory protein AphA